MGSGCGQGHECGLKREDVLEDEKEEIAVVSQNECCVVFELFHSFHVFYPDCKMDATRCKGGKKRLLPKTLACIEKAGLDVPSDNNVRDLINKVHGATMDYRSTFLGQPRKICCVRVPRHILSPELLQQVDKCMYKL